MSYRILVTAEEKGYPSVISPLKIVAEFDDETNRLKGYTSFKDLGKFHFVGNGYVYDREGGVYRKVLDFRDNFLGSSKPKVTLLNPIEGTNLARLSAMVEKRGGVKIEKYSQVDDIMSEPMYNEMKKLPMYRYPPYKEEVKKWQEVLKKKKAKKDACYHKVKSRYKKWPSAYASGALVQCRKVGAANWGNKKK